MSNFILGRTRSGRIARLALLLVVATGGTSYATTGYTANPRSVTFYYGETGGHGDSDNFSGYGSVDLCMNSQGAPSGDSHTFEGDYFHNYTGFPDTLVYGVSIEYNYGEYQAPVGSTSSGNKYHVRAWWQGVSAASDSKKGYVASRTHGYACVWP